MRTRKQYRALLDRAHGYAAYAGRMLPARRTPASSQRAWNLSQAIAARYAAIERRWPLMAFVYEQPDRTGVSVSNTYHTTHPSIFMNPRVILRMLVSHREEIKRVVADRNPARTFGREAVPMTLAASPGQKLESQQDDVIARIVRRAVRDENPVREDYEHPARRSARVVQVTPVANVASMQTPSIARVFRHVAKANNDSSVVAVKADHEQEKPRLVAGRDMSAATVVQSQSDITRITDQVMQALDKRIVAQRERLGRI